MMGGGTNDHSQPLTGGGGHTAPTPSAHGSPSLTCSRTRARDMVGCGVGCERIGVVCTPSATGVCMCFEKARNMGRCADKTTQVRKQKRWKGFLC